MRVAAFKATTAFLTSIDDSETVLAFKDIVPVLLSTVVEALKTDEDQGKMALTSMVELTSIHSELWKDCVGQIVEIASQIMGTAQFEDGTRAVALEIVISLSQHIPAQLRKSDVTRTVLFPTFFRMMAELDDDVDTWLETRDEDETGRTDAFSVGKDGLNNLSVFMKEKVTMASCMGIIQEGTMSSDWKLKVAGLYGLGIIAEACKESMTSNMEEVIKKACTGLMDEHPRVRYAALSCLALLVSELAPLAQKKFHDQLMPVLLKMIESETSLKMRTHTVSCTINFVQGLTEEDADEREDTKKSSSLIAKYQDTLL